MNVSRALLFIPVVVLAAPAGAVDWTDPRAVVAAALENHPTVLRLQSEAAAARERILPAASLPNPMLMGGVQNKEVDFGDDQMMTMYVVGAQQTLTNPARRRARQSAAELELRAVEQQIITARAELEREALMAWYDVAAADSQIGAAEEIRRTLGAVIDAVRARYETGGSMQADIVRAQLERSMLDHRIIGLRGDRKAAAARLLTLMGLPPDSDVPPLHLPQAVDQVPAASGVSLSHPALAALQAELEQQDEIVRLARLADRPDVSLEAMYSHRRMQTDMVSLVASIELPLRRKSIVEPRIREAVARREAASRRIEEMRRELSRSMAIARVASEQAREHLDFHHEMLVPQARLAFESTLAAYQTGKATFDAVLAAESAHLRLQFEHYELLARYLKALVDLEAVRKGATGFPLSAGSMQSAASAGSMGGMR